MPRAFLVKKPCVSTCKRNWSELPDEERGEIYVPGEAWPAAPRPRRHPARGPVGTAESGRPTSGPSGRSPVSPRPGGRGGQGGGGREGAGAAAGERRARAPRRAGGSGRVGGARLRAATPPPPPPSPAGAAARGRRPGVSPLRRPPLSRRKPGKRGFYEAGRGHWSDATLGGRERAGVSAEICAKREGRPAPGLRTCTAGRGRAPGDSGAGPPVTNAAPRPPAAAQ